MGNMSKKTYGLALLFVVAIALAATPASAGCTSDTKINIPGPLTGRMFTFKQSQKDPKKWAVTVETGKMAMRCWRMYLEQYRKHNPDSELSDGEVRDIYDALVSGEWKFDPRKVWTKEEIGIVDAEDLTVTVNNDESALNPGSPPSNTVEVDTAKKEEDTAPRNPDSLAPITVDKTKEELELEKLASRPSLSDPTAAMYHAALGISHEVLQKMQEQVEDVEDKAKENKEEVQPVVELMYNRLRPNLKEVYRQGTYPEGP